ncbi:Tripeptidyl-peptidase 1, partial [Manacus vitellinus]
RLARLVEAVSDPRSSQYGQYLSLEQVRDLVQPSPATLMTVLKWLQDHGVEDCRTVTTLDFLECHLPASPGAMSCPPGALCPDGPSGPTGLCRSGWDAPVPCGAHGQQSRGQEGRGVSGSVVPPGCDAGHPAPEIQHDRGGRGAPAQQQPGLCTGAGGLLQPPVLVVLLGQGPLRCPPPLVSLCPCPAVPTGRHESQEPFLAWLLLLSNMSAVPWVHSVSYGDDEDSLSLAYMERVNAEFMKAAARGLTVLFASGDDGAGCRRVHSGNHTFRPSFPASSPYVTTVGGTSFKNPFLVTEEGTDYISGGDFSNIFPMPGYQVR